MPWSFPASRYSAATGALSRRVASFSTMTTAKERGVRWPASDSSVSRKCCGRRKQGMQTTVPTDRSRTRELAAISRLGSRTASVMRLVDSSVGIRVMISLNGRDVLKNPCSRTAQQACCETQMSQYGAVPRNVASCRMTPLRAVQVRKPRDPASPASSSSSTSPLSRFFLANLHRGASAIFEPARSRGTMRTMP